MSTALKQDTALPAATANRTQALIAASALQPHDRVVVIGGGSLDHLLGLVRSGCQSASAGRSRALCRAEDEADVVWLTGVTGIDAEVADTVDGLDTPRVVVIELTRTCSKAALSAVLGRLRAKGLVDQAVRKGGGRTVVVASRPAWLQRVI